MGKNTDYKKMWRKSQDQNKILAGKIVQLDGLVKGYAKIIEDIKSGKIKVPKPTEKKDES